MDSGFPSKTRGYDESGPNTSGRKGFRFGFFGTPSGSFKEDEGAILM